MASPQNSLDSFNCKKTLEVAGKSYTYFDLKTAEANGLTGLSKLPFSLKVLVENLLRFEDGSSVTKEDILAFTGWLKEKRSTHEIAYRPARVLMQDFTGVPAVVDLAAMRDAMKDLGGNAKSINPQVPVDLVIDHSVMVDYFGGPDAFAQKRSPANMNATSSVTNFCAGALMRLKISASCRLEPAFAIRSIWNICQKPSGPPTLTAKPMPIPIRWLAPIATQ